MINWKNLWNHIIRPSQLKNLGAHILIAIPRIICGLLLTIDFGASKFGMPWTEGDRELGLFEVAEWFVGDVGAMGFPFSIAPAFFAWMAAGSEAIGGVFFTLGLGTRIVAALLICTMLVAIIFQGGKQGTWSMLPAMGFLWVSLYALVLGSGKIGLDHWLTKNTEN